MTARADAPLTPEHLQLLSDQALEKAARPADADRQSAGSGRALERAARYELRRRSCEVPVHDRYGDG